MLRLSRLRLERLRDQLQKRGQRPSMILATTDPNVAEAVQILEEYGPMCEAMYLVMAADGRVFNVEREVMRGALDVLSDGRVRTRHMEAMVDACARASAQEGQSTRLRKVVDALHDDPLRAETTLVLAAAVAAADGKIAPEEQVMFDSLAKGLEIGEERAAELLDELTAQLDDK